MDMYFKQVNRLLNWAFLKSVGARNELLAYFVNRNCTFSRVHQRSKIDGQMLIYFTREQER
jgi:hypothetical protein